MGIIKTIIPTSNDLSKLQITNPKKALSNSSVSTIEDVLKIRGLPSLSRLAKTSTIGQVKLVIIKWLMEANESLNLKRPMTEDQILQAANFLYEDHSNFNVADLTVFFKKLIKGQFGNFYESFSTSKLMIALKEYEDTRYEIAATNSQQDHTRFKDNTDLQADRISKRRQ
jgi:hypothetical protein